jgi:hypothetical protein
MVRTFFRVSPRALAPSALAACFYCTSPELLHHPVGPLIAGPNILFCLFGLFHLAFPCLIRAGLPLHSITTPLEGMFPFSFLRQRRSITVIDKKTFKKLESSSKIRLHCIYHSPHTFFFLSADLTTYTYIFRHISRSLAMLPTCCERWRLRFDSFCIFYLRYRPSLG